MLRLFELEKNVIIINITGHIEKGKRNKRRINLKSELVYEDNGGCRYVSSSKRIL